jgi:hypothetical protein
MDPYGTFCLNIHRPVSFSLSCFFLWPQTDEDSHVMSNQNSVSLFHAHNSVSDDVLPALRAQLIDLLPRAMACAIASYREFSAQTAPEDAKQFIAHHNACRAALAHVDYLSKLAKFVQTAHPHPDDDQDLQPLIHKAREMLVQMTQHSAPDLSSDDDQMDV